jgi:hypothetical protein
VQPPALDRATDLLRGLVRDGWEEADEQLAASISGASRTKRVPEEIEPLVLVRAGAVCVLAVHDARLVQIELQTDLRQPRDDRVAHDLRLLPALAVQDLIIRIALKRHVRELPDKPHVQRVVQKDVGQHGRDRRALRAAAIPGLQGAVLQLDWRFQPPLHIEKDPPQVCVVSNRF